MSLLMSGFYRTTPLHSHISTGGDQSERGPQAVATDSALPIFVFPRNAAVGLLMGQRMVIIMKLSIILIAYLPFFLYQQIVEKLFVARTSP